MAVQIEPVSHDDPDDLKKQRTSKQPVIDAWKALENPSQDRLQGYKLTHLPADIRDMERIRQAYEKAYKQAEKDHWEARRARWAALEKVQSDLATFRYGKTGADPQVDAYSIYPDEELTADEFEGVKVLTADEIIVPENRLRSVDDEAVGVLVDSMARHGQMDAITVSGQDLGDAGPVYTLVAGAHRLEAIKRLGWDLIAVTFTAASDSADDARIVEITENLHRKELTVLERAEHLQEYGRLLDKLSNKSDQTGGRPESIATKIAAETGLNRKAVARDLKVAESLSTEAKVAAKDAGLADNQKALLQVAKAVPDRQVDAVQTIAAKGSVAAAVASPKPVQDPESAISTEAAAILEIVRGKSAEEVEQVFAEVLQVLSVRVGEAA